ncbi:MAG: radical SAM protein [Candidatus Omnitrophota bacterium]
MMDRRPKVKLIFPCMFEPNEACFHPIAVHLPYGMGVLTSYLKSQDIYVEQDDLSVRFNHESTLFDLVRHSELSIKKFQNDLMIFFKTNKVSLRLERLLCRIIDSTSIEKFDIIGFSIFSYRYFLFALLLSRTIKKSPNTLIVFGGPFITLYGQLYPGAFKFIDFMIRGDGGMPLSQLAHCLIQKISPEQIPGLIYKHDGTLTVIPVKECPIEEMPMPDFEGLPLDLYRTKNFHKNLYIPYQISRGCNGACKFCCIKNIDPFLEYKSYHKVITELQQLKEKYGTNFFYFCDSGAINTSNEYLEGLCDALIDNKINICWGAYARIEHLDRVILGKMKLAGCWKLHLGVESGSNRMLGIMNKGLTTEQIQGVLRDAAGLGIRNFIYFISGYPNERREDIVMSADFIRRNRKYIWFAEVFILKVSYGSELWKRPERYGITNLVPFKRFPQVYKFDEVEGFRWQEKCIQQKRSEQQIRRAILRYLVFGLIKEVLFQTINIFYKTYLCQSGAKKRKEVK